MSEKLCFRPVKLIYVSENAVSNRGLEWDGALERHESLRHIE